MFTFNIHHHVHNECALDDSMKRSISKLTKLGDSIMATLAEVKAALDALATKATTEKEEVTAALAELTTTIEALQEAVNGGAQVTAEDLDGLVATIGEIGTQVENITVPAGSQVPEVTE